MTAYDTPRFVVPDQNLIPVDPYLGSLYETPPSRMFIIKLSLKKYVEKMRARRRSPMTPRRGTAAHRCPVSRRRYWTARTKWSRRTAPATISPMGRTNSAKRSIEQYWQLDPALGWGPKNVLATVGGRDALVKAYTAMIALGTGGSGDAVMTSRVPWISYNWGPYGVGANVLLAPGDEVTAWQYSEDGIRAAVDFCQQRWRASDRRDRSSPRRITPPGTRSPLERQIALGKCALGAGVSFVLYDWMYHYITETGPPAPTICCAPSTRRNASGS